MPYTMEDFQRQYAKENFRRLTPEERREALAGLPLEERLAGLSAEQIRRYLDRLTAPRSPGVHKRRRKKLSRGRLHHANHSTSRER